MVTALQSALRSARYFSVVMLISLAVNSVQAQGLVIHHAMGETEVPQDALRIVTLFQGATDSAIALGVTPVGVVDSWAQKPTYLYLREALAGVEHVGLETQPNLEAIAALKPDVIIGTKARHEKIYSQLSDIAPTVMAENVYDFQYTLTLTAQAVGKPDAGKQQLSALQNRIGTFRSALTATQPDWPLTASVLNIRADHLRLYLQESFAGAVLKEIGFTFPMPSKTGWGIKLKTKEAIPSANADVFFIILHSDDQAVKQNYDAWQSHPLWKVLDAPKNGQVYEVDRVTWLLSGGILGANLMLDELFKLYGIPLDTQ